MCIMEVRAGQHNSTIAQACAHNVNTVIGDLDMFTALLRAKGQHSEADMCENTQATLAEEYVNLRDMFAEFAVSEPHKHDDTVGNERESALTLAQTMDAAIKRARPFESR